MNPWTLPLYSSAGERASLLSQRAGGRAVASPPLARPSLKTSATTSLTRSANCSNRVLRESRRPGSWLRLRAGLLLLVVLALPASVQGCCSEARAATLPRPVLPAGEPSGAIDAHLKGQNSRGVWAWGYPIGGVVSLPIEDLMELLELKEEWKAFARALVAAGRWR